MSHRSWNPKAETENNPPLSRKKIIKIQFSNDDDGAQRSTNNKFTPHTMTINRIYSFHYEYRYSKILPCCSGGVIEPQTADILIEPSSSHHHVYRMCLRANG